MPRRSSRSRSSRFGSKASVAPKKKSPASAGLVTMEETSQAHAASRPNRGATTDRAHTNSRSLQICNRVVFAYRIRQTRQLRPPDSRQARPKKTQPPADNRGSRTALERLGGLTGWTVQHDNSPPLRLFLAPRQIALAIEPPASRGSGTGQTAEIPDDGRALVTFARTGYGPPA